MTHWVYPVSPRGGAVLIDERTGAHTELTDQTLRPHITTHATSDSWPLTTGYRAMRPGDRVWVYLSSPVQALAAVGTARDVSQTNTGWKVDLAWDLPATHRLDAHPIPLKALGFVPYRVRRLSATGIAVAEDWLANAAPHDPDLSGEVPTANTEGKLTGIGTIVQRPGQPEFRDRLMAAFEARCTITGCPDEAVLEAAHIVPFTGSNDTPGNGLLLRRDIHALFDRHLIGIDAHNRVRVSRALKDPAYRKLQGTTLRTPRDPRWTPNQDALREHLLSLQ